MYIKRVLTEEIIKKLKKTNKGIIIFGPRQVGKTTLVNEIIKKTGFKTLIINGDQISSFDIFKNRNLSQIKPLVSSYQMLFVDEAQRIPEIGINLKIVLDNIKNIKVIVTGSSSLDLASKITEPLTGRVFSYHLFPISFLERSKIFTSVELIEQLEQSLIFGAYPEIFSLTTFEEKIEFLKNLSDGYLYKDLLEFGNIKNSYKIRDLLKLLAFQVGSLVSLSELGAQLSLSKETVRHYIDLLEKSFVIFRLSGLSRNLRKEISKMDKIYFYDLGVRNAIIDNFKLLKDRNDVGKFWENFLIIERIKRNHYKKIYFSKYFWRLHSGEEIDYIEEREGKLFAFEFKWKEKYLRKPLTLFKTYNQAEYKLITKEDFLEFIL